MKLLKLAPAVLLSFSLLFLGSCSSDSKDSEPAEKLSSEKSILDFSVGETKASIDEAEKTITISFPAGTDVSNLTPTIKVSAKATVSLEAGTELDLTSPKGLTVTAEDKSTVVYTATAIVAKNTDAKILTFEIFGMKETATTTIDEEKKTIDVVVPFGTDVTRLIPVITISGSSISPANEEMKNFSTPVIYTVTAEDGKTVPYTVSVTVDKFDIQIESVSETRLYPNAKIEIKGSFAQAKEDNTAELRGENLPVIALEVHQVWAGDLMVEVPGLVADGTYRLYVTSHGAKTEYDGDIIVSNTMPVISRIFYEHSLVKGYSKLMIDGKNLEGTEVIVHARHIDADKPYGSFNLQDHEVSVNAIRIESKSGFFELGEQEVMLEIDGVLSNPRIITTVERPDPTIVGTEVDYEMGRAKILGRFVGFLDPVEPKTDVYVYDEESKTYKFRDRLRSDFGNGNGEGHENYYVKFSQVTDLKAGDKIKVKMITMSGKETNFSDEILIK